LEKIAINRNLLEWWWWI